MIAASQINIAVIRLCKKFNRAQKPFRLHKKLKTFWHPEKQTVFRGFWLAQNRRFWLAQKAPLFGSAENQKDFRAKTIIICLKPI